MVQSDPKNDAECNKTSVGSAEQNDASTSPRIIERKKVTAVGEELGQYVRDLYNSGAKLWTKEMFHDIEAELAKDPIPHAVMIRSNLTFLVVTVNGVVRRKQIPHFPKKPYLVIFPHFKIYQQMVRDAEEETLEIDHDERNELARNLPLKPFTDDDRTLVTRALSLAGGEEFGSRIEYDQMKNAWDEAKQNWLQSPACRDLTAILADASHNFTAVSKIVCFGLGSLEGLPGPSALDKLAPCDGLPRRRAMTQHAAALTIAAVLGKRLGTDPLPILVQDPIYPPIEKRLLAEEGIVVVGGRGSLAFTHVDENTLVFSISPNIPVKQIVADIAKPAAMIWDRVRPAADEKSEQVLEVRNGEEIIISPWCTDEDSPRTRMLVSEYAELDFPSDEERFGDLIIYVRKEVAVM